MTPDSWPTALPQGRFGNDMMLEPYLEDYGYYSPCSDLLSMTILTLSSTSAFQCPPLFFDSGTKFSLQGEYALSPATLRTQISCNRRSTHHVSRSSDDLVQAHVTSTYSVLNLWHHKMEVEPEAQNVS